MAFWKKETTISELKDQLKEKDKKLRSLSKEYDELAEAYKEAIKPISIPPCTHTWLDFPWYLQHSFDNDSNSPAKGISILEIYEPYVCVHCQKRKDVKLYRERQTSMTLENHLKKMEQWNELYKDHLKPKPVVEDMINDAIMVDKGKIAIVAKLRGIENEEGKDKDSYRVGLALH